MSSALKMDQPMCAHRLVITSILNVQSVFMGQSRFGSVWLPVLSKIHPLELVASVDANENAGVSEFIAKYHKEEAEFMANFVRNNMKCLDIGVLVQGLALELTLKGTDPKAIIKIGELATTSCSCSSSSCSFHRATQGAASVAAPAPAPAPSVDSPAPAPSVAAPAPEPAAVAAFAAFADALASYASLPQAVRDHDLRVLANLTQTERDQVLDTILGGP